jgi:hypothetical protein
MNKMKKVLFMMFCLLFASMPALAAEPVKSTPKPRSSIHSHQAGMVSLDLTILPLNTDAASDPQAIAILGGKYFLTDTSALEGGLGFSYRNEKSSENQEKGFGLGLYGAYVYYLANKRISPYLKVGLGITSKNGAYYEPDDNFGFNAIGGMGAEFFVTKGFSISAEALIRLQLSPTVIFESVEPSIKASFYFDNFL